jgi:hypothetical protein
MGIACSMHGRGEKCLRRACYKPELKRPIDRPRRRWEDVEVRKEMRRCMDWTHVLQDGGRLLSI